MFLGIQNSRCWKTYKSAVTILPWKRNQLWMRWLERLKDGKAPGGDGIPAEVWKYGRANLSNRLHRWIIKVWEEGHTRYISSFCIQQDLCSDPTEQILKPHYPRGGARDTVRLSFKQKHSRHDRLPMTTPGKMHRVYCLCRLYEGIRHRLEDWTMAATEEIWMPLKVHNHVKKSAYRNDGERQEWRGGLR